jgi:outer membrane protein TolC
MSKVRFIGLAIISLLGLPLKAQVKIVQLDELYALADTMSFACRVQKSENDIAELAKNVSYANALNPRIPIHASIIDNTELPVNFIPSEVFGGSPGTFREIVFGQQYISTITATPQFDLVSPSKWAEVQMAKVFLEKAQVQGEVAKRDLRNVLSSYYYKLVELEEQAKILYKNVALSDSILAAVQQRFVSGLARESEANEAYVFLLKQENEYERTKVQQRMLLLQLENLLGVEIEVKGTLVVPNVGELDTISKERQLVKLELAYSKSALRASRWDQLPVLSFVSSFSFQNNSNRQFFDDDERWINSNYIGLRLSWDFPTNVQKNLQVRSKQLNYRIAQLRYQQSVLVLKNKITENDLELERLRSLVLRLGEIRELEFRNFDFAKVQYEQSLLSIDRLLQVQLNALQAELNENAAKASLAIQAALINNGL